MADELTVDVERGFPSGSAVSGKFGVPVAGSEVTVLFGPSGSGKTTLLRCVAGLDRPDAGRVAWAGEIWSDARSGQWIRPQMRRIGFVPHDPALFPRRTVAGNIAFGLRRWPADERSTRVEEMLDVFGIDGMAGRRPSELSAGQRQRVALARAVAPRPRVLLLDEPFSALDAPAREVLRQDLRGLLAAAGVPSIVVTHDRTEALAVGDRMVVVVGGRVRQTDTVERVFTRPADIEVAAAVGVENVLRGRLLELSGGLAALEVGGRTLNAVDNGCPPGDALACIRAEEVALRLGQQAPAESARNHLLGTVARVAREGPLFRVVVDCGFELAALVTIQSKSELGLEPGRDVVAVLKATSIHCIRR